MNQGSLPCSEIEDGGILPQRFGKNRSRVKRIEQSFGEDFVFQDRFGLKGCKNDFTRIAGIDQLLFESIHETLTLKEKQQLLQLIWFGEFIVKDGTFFAHSGTQFLRFFFFSDHFVDGRAFGGGEAELCDFNWPQAAMMSRPRGIRTGLA